MNISKATCCIMPNKRL